MPEKKVVNPLNTNSYSDREVEACKRVLIEVVSLFSEFNESMAVVGGWVPFFIIKDPKAKHVGTLDVDICFDSSKIQDDSYESMGKKLEASGYELDTATKFQWSKAVVVDDKGPIKVRLDLLAGEYGGTGKGHRTQKIQDSKARKARGSDLIFDPCQQFEVEELQGESASGGKDTVSFKVAGAVAFIIMKGMAIAQRKKNKDAYDIWYVVNNYPDGIDGLVQAFTPFKDEVLVQEGLGKIRTKFESEDHRGPIDVVTFLEIEENEERQRIKSQVYLVVKELLDQLKIVKFVDTPKGPKEAT